MISDDIRAASIEKRLGYFEDILVAHPHLVNTFNKLLKVLEQRDSPFLMGVVGASGSGTTLLRLLLEQHIIQQWIQSPSPNLGLIPLVSVSARALGIPFDLKDYRVQLLVALREPLIDHKIEPGDEKRRRRPTDNALQHALQQSLQHRKPVVVVVDNAQHFLVGGYTHDDVDLQLTSGSNERAMHGAQRNQIGDSVSQLAEHEHRHHLDVIQTIRETAERTHVRHVLFGSYKILDVLDTDTRLGNSNTCLSIPRYALAKRQDAEAFSSILLTLQKHLPLEKEPDLVSCCEELYAGCLGSVGFLKKRLYRTLASALDQGLTTITIDLLRKNAEDPMTLARLGMEIIEGEKSIALRNTAGSDGNSSKKQPRTARPFTRKPMRDKTSI